MQNQAEHHKIIATPQTDEIGREYKLNGIRKLSHIAKKWDDAKKTYLNHWLITYKYTDDGSYFALELDYTDRIVRKLSHSEVLNFSSDIAH